MGRTEMTADKHVRLDVDKDGKVTAVHRHSTQVILPEPSQERIAAANARRRLEDAAPDLLAALKAIVRHYSDYLDDPLNKEARAAIAKAEGDKS
jgi:hypothetical protein